LKTIGKSALKVLRNLWKKITFEVFLVNNSSEAKAIVQKEILPKTGAKSVFMGRLFIVHRDRALLLTNWQISL